MQNQRLYKLPEHELPHQASLHNQLLPPSSPYHQEQNSPQKHLSTFELPSDKQTTLFKTLGIISFALWLIIIIYLAFNRSQINTATYNDALQSSQIDELTSQLKQYKQKADLNLKNLSEIIQSVRLETIRMEVDLFKNENHNKNLFDITRYEKSDMWLSIHDFQNKVAYSQPKYIQEIINIKKNLKPLPPLPKVIWLFTEFKFQGEKMMEQLMGNYVIKKAQESGYEIRKVNSWSVYEWLSSQTQEKITKTMQNMKIQQKVNEVLRMALLMEHGGIMLRVSETFMIDNLNWLQKYFKLSQDSNSDKYNQVLVFSQTSSPNQKPQYQDFFIAAVQKSSLITDTFDILCKTISTGVMEFKRLKDAAYINKDMNSTVVKDITKNIIHSLLEIMTPQYYTAVVINADVSLFVKPQCRDRLPYLLKRPVWEYKTDCGEPVHFIHFSDTIDRSKIEDELENQLTTEVLGADQYGYWHSWMTISENRKVFDPLPQRPVSFCLIDAHPNPSPQTLIRSFEKFKQQTFTKWTAVYFVDSEMEETKKYAEEQRKMGFKIELVKHTGSIGRNYEVGIIKNCPNKTFVVVLRRNERIEDNQGLEMLSRAVARRQILGAFVGINISGTVKQSDTYFQYYNKVEFNGRDPQYPILANILNYMRVFHSDCYKLIPQFVLRTPQGLYFNDRFVFLEQFLFMVRNLTQKHDYTQIPHTQRVKWFIKSNAHLFDVPKKIILHPNFIINTETWDEVDRNEIKRNSYKTDSFAMTYNMDHLVQNGIPMNEFAVFNPALEYEPYTRRNKPDIIPKIIHVIWIQGQMPQVKLKILNMNKAMYPDFEFKVWSKLNITKERFPLSYDLLQTIYNMENITRYSKRATMADVLRHEVLYNEGGFYMDTSMVLFNNIFYKWLSYKFVLSTQRTFRHRWAQSMCIFGVMPKFQGLLRIISPNNTNRYNIFLRDALQIAGPHNFRWTVRGHEEYDPDFLIMDYDTFYPMTYALPNYYETYCLIQPVFLKDDDEVVMSWKGRSLINNCGKYYPYSFGKEINTIGSSWQNPKW